jgi:hypothetical protein
MEPQIMGAAFSILFQYLASFSIPPALWPLAYKPKAGVVESWLL